MAFLETPVFPTDIAFGCVGGPGFSTGVVNMASGYESRNANWSESRHEYEASQAVQNTTALATMIAFFRIARGRLNGFRFRDIVDYSVTAGVDGVLTVITANTTWQMGKRYTSGSSTNDRAITKPRSGTVTVAGGGTYTVDYTTGIVTKTGGSNPTGWTGEFDVPCRFDIDRLQYEVVDRNASEVLVACRSIPLLEIRT